MRAMGSAAAFFTTVASSASAMGPSALASITSSARPLPRSAAMTADATPSAPGPAGATRYDAGPSSQVAKTSEGNDPDQSRATAAASANRWVMPHSLPDRRGQPERLLLTVAQRGATDGPPSVRRTRAEVATCHAGCSDDV